MLRGVNVGGHNKIKMDLLRALCETVSMRNPQTYVQSGNVVCRTNQRDSKAIAKKLQQAIERDFGFSPEVITRTVSELRDVIARNPFAQRPEVEPNKLLVTFLADDPGPEARAKVLRIPTEPEELHIDGREIYTYFPNGQARPKLSWAAVERAVQTPGTGRNWNTVTKLLEMAEQLESMP